MSIPAMKLTKNSGNPEGFALITALMFLVILTLLGIGVYSTTTSEERMARNFRDQEIALQGAEAALNEAKIRILASYDNVNYSPTSSQKPLVITASSCLTTIAGFACEPTGISNYNTYDLFASGSLGAAVGSINNSSTPWISSPTIVGLSSQPRYLILLQQHPSTCGASNTGSCFKLIAQAKGRLDSTRVNVIEYFTN
jgi:Tfp pilus assembly protein PilX